MPKTKYEFMQDMLIRARNRHRRELGLCPEQPEVVPGSPEPSLSPDRPAGGFDGTQENPMPLGGE